MDSAGSYRVLKRQRMHHTGPAWVPDMGVLRICKLIDRLRVGSQLDGNNERDAGSRGELRGKPSISNGGWQQHTSVRHTNLDRSFTVTSAKRGVI